MIAEISNVKLDYIILGTPFITYLFELIFLTPSSKFCR